MAMTIGRLLGVLLMVGVGSGSASESSHPGYVDLTRLAGLDDADVLVDVRLGGWLLGLMRVAAEQSQHKDLAVLSSIDSVRVRVVHLDDEHFGDQAQELVELLADQGWEEFARVRKSGHWAQVMVKGSENRIEGITVLAMESSEEAVFVNIAGRLDPRDIARILANKDLIHADLDLEF